MEIIKQELDSNRIACYYGEDQFRHDSCTTYWTVLLRVTVPVEVSDDPRDWHWRGILRDGIRRDDVPFVKVLEALPLFGE